MSELLEFSKYTNLSNWSVSHLLENKFQYNKDYKLEKIGSFLKRNKTQVILNDSTEYKRVKIKLYNKGVLVRDREFGKNIKTKKQFLVKEGQFLLSKIDARNGAFGIANSEVHDAIITADFLAYDIDTTRIEPYFLVLMTTTKKFQQFAQSASSGTTGRQRIDEKKFLDVTIPLPSAEIQRRIVRNYQEKIDLSIFQDEEVDQKAIEIEKYLNKELGINRIKIPKLDKSLLQVINFKDMCNQWGFNDNNTSNSKSSNFKTYKLKDIAMIGSGGTPSRSELKYYKNGTIPWIKTGEVRDKIIYDAEEYITEDALKKSSAKIYPKNSLIIAMYGATAGRTAKLGIDLATNQACAVLYNINVNMINIDFLWFYLISQLENFKLLSTGSAQPNLNAAKVKNFEVPLPSLKVQDKIIIQLNILKKEIEGLKKKSLINKEHALTEFEKEIFNET